MKNFVNNIAEKYGLNHDITHAFVEHMRYVEVDKNIHIIEKGGFNDCFYIVRKGILRAYVPDEGGGQTLWFGYPGQVVFDVWCYHYRKPSRITIEAVVPSVLYAIIPIIL